MIQLHSVSFADNDLSQDSTHRADTIYLDQEQIESSGIKLQRLNKIKFIPEQICFGEIINIQPLIEAKKNYQLASLKLETATTDFAFQQKTLNRLQNLYRQKAISNDKFQKQLEKWRSSKKILLSARLELESTQETIALDWGAEFLNWMTTPNDYPELNSVITGDSNIVMISLPANNTLIPKIPKIYIHPTGDRNLAFIANYIGPAPKVTPLSQGKSFFFLTENPILRTGMHITAWIPQPTQLTGVLIPKSAMIWHLGQPYIYLEISANTFSRYLITNSVISKNGFFVADINLIDKKVVKTGAQALLGEEFRSQIPEEDDDD